MATLEQIQTLFSSSAKIPDEYQIPRLDQKEYLCDGEIKIWNGPRQEVFSPVCRVENGKAQRIPIGSFPLLSQQEAFALVDAAPGPGTAVSELSRRGLLPVAAARHAAGAAASA